MRSANVGPVSREALVNTVLHHVSILNRCCAVGEARVSSDAVLVSMGGRGDSARHALFAASALTTRIVRAVFSIRAIQGV